MHRDNPVNIFVAEYLYFNRPGNHFRIHTSSFSYVNQDILLESNCLGLATQQST